MGDYERNDEMMVMVEIESVIPSLSCSVLFPRDVLCDGVELLDVPYQRPSR